jgi:hypothetical protein
MIRRLAARVQALVATLVHPADAGAGRRLTGASARVPR